MYSLDILIKFFNSSTCLLTPSFIHLLSKDLLDSCYMPCTVLGAGEIVVGRTDVTPGRWSGEAS